MPSGGKWDKALRELAEELIYRHQTSSADEVFKHFEAVLRERLESLLDAAEVVCAWPGGAHEKLSEEVSKWKK